ncbi:hypothetical protein GCM10023231_20390 [Olivibacter ginsenosidimutans]|uniref:Tetratricopeptide repeat protein n=1 Tax=Olivibacter ginsenosidimutans TaxID=1176537 RepID=A0ABP9BAM7_9SPHI
MPRAEERIRERLDHAIQPSDTAFLKQNALYEQAIKVGKPADQAIALQKMGQICFQLGLFAQALNYHLQAENLIQHDPKQDSLRAANLNDLGLLLFLNNQTQDAQAAYHQALNIYQRRKDQKGIANTYGNMGHLQEKLANYDSAFFYQDKAMSVFESINDLDGIAVIDENLGSIYEDKEQFDAAFAHFSKALARFEVNGNGPMYIDALNNVGDVYRKSRKYEQALLYTRKAEKKAKEIKAYKQLSSTYRDIGKTYYYLKNPDSTFHYLELARNLYLTIYSEDAKNQAALLKVLYDLEQKDARIAEMGREKKMASIVYGSSIIVAFLLIVLAIVIIRNQRHHLKSERKLRDKESALLKAKQSLMEAELQNKKLEEAQLSKTLETKAREITTHTLQAIEKNQLLEEMKNSLTAIIKSDSRSYKKELKQLLNKINQNFNKDVRWEDFRKVFEEIHQDFFDKLHHINPALSSSDLRLISLIKMNLDASEIATLLGISADSLRVSRYRLRKKLGMEQGKSLTAFIQSIG